MTTLDRFGWWIAKPGNCNKVYAAGIAFALVVGWLTGEWSPLP